MLLDRLFYRTTWFRVWIALCLIPSIGSRSQGEDIFADIDLTDISIERHEYLQDAELLEEPSPSKPHEELNEDPTENLLPSQAGGSYLSELENLAQPSRIGSSLKLILTMSVISLAPAILLMTTSFIRISIVLGLLRQAFGAQQLPPNQVLTSLSLFMTMMIMWPVWTHVYDDAVEPYSDPNIDMSWQEAWQRGIEPVRNFMIQQIETTGNTDDVRLFVRHAPGATQNPANYGEVPTQALLPAFVLSELKTAFLLGFQIYLPFLIIDIVVATLTMSMGMVMLPPTMMSLPLKLLLFVLVDGWHLLVGMLLESFHAQSM